MRSIDNYIVERVIKTKVRATVPRINALLLLLTICFYLPSIAAVPIFTKLCDWTVYKNKSQKYDCTTCCNDNNGSCQNQKATCRVPCLRQEIDCDAQQEVCKDQCKAVRGHCYNNCDKDQACEDSCDTAKLDCYADCDNDEDTCVAAPYTFGSPVFYNDSGILGCKNDCNKAQEQCSTEFVSACNSYCDNLPGSISHSSFSSSGSLSSKPRCEAKGWAGITIDAFRGALEDPIDSTTGTRKTSRETEEVTIFSKGTINTIVNKNSTAHLQTSSEQSASFVKQTSDPKIFGGTSALLFNFERYKQAAIATNNYHANLCDFYDKQVKANATLYGIIYVVADYNNIPCRKKDSAKTVEFKEGSINVWGSLVLDLINFPTPDDVSGFRLEFSVPLNINPIIGPSSGSISLNYWDYQSFKKQTIAGHFDPKGANDPYEQTWSSIVPAHGKSPFDFNLGSNHPSFSSVEDLPALMYKGGYIDVHHKMNVNGIMYSPNYIEIEQKGENNVQFLNGALVGGAGIFLEDKNCSSGIFISYHPRAVDSMGVVNPKLLTKIGYSVD